MIIPEKAQLVLRNGQVITVNQQDEIAQAVAIADNKIVFVGTNVEVEKFIGADTKVVDLEGRSLLPGFIDSHIHMAAHGTNEIGIDCRYPNVTSIEDIKRKIKEAASKTSPGKWIRAWGYDHSKLLEKRHPTRWDLDEVSPNNPVVLIRTCFHISTYNSKALEMAGITPDTPDPKGGKIEKENGIPTGVMKEMAHMNMLQSAPYSLKELIEALRIVDQKLTAMGITSVHDAGGYGPVQMQAMQQVVLENQIHVRIYSMLFSIVDNLNFINTYLPIGLHTRFGNDKLKLGGFKVMMDGSSSGPTAATRKPYTSNPEDSGILYFTQEEVNDLFLKAHLADFQVTAHAVGDKAVEMVVTAIEQALIAKPKNDHRHRIEHCAIVDPQLIKRIKQNGIVPIPQPVFFYEFGDSYLANYGSERVRYMFPCKSYLEEGIMAAMSSDCPVTVANPLLGIYEAVNRITQSGQLIPQEENITIQEAIRMYTLHGAYASFDEDIKGSLEIGKLADMVVLSESILNCPPNKIKNIEVDMTIIDGEIVYTRS